MEIVSDVQLKFREISLSADAWTARVTTDGRWLSKTSVVTYLNRNCVCDVSEVKPPNKSDRKGEWPHNADFVILHRTRVETDEPNIFWMAYFVLDDFVMTVFKLLRVPLG